MAVVVSGSLIASASALFAVSLEDYTSPLLTMKFSVGLGRPCKSGPDYNIDIYGTRSGADVDTTASLA
ncbi:hypothetical protein CAURIC_00415 [Corynebacterium auriscanis]|nr:hypothetical protein CAURIC_00415 [Corynebacterium auriscanis]